MANHDRRTIVVCGATGRQGGAVVRRLIADGWQVKGLTRKPGAAKARALADTGAEVAHCDMSDRAGLERAFAGAHGVFSVQNPMISGFEAEVQQGRNVAEAAKAAGVQHIVYGAAGIGERTGIPSWDSKVDVEEHMDRLGVPATVLRPKAFMELLTDKTYYPPVIWHLMTKLAGGDRKIPWLSVDDLGVIAARAFAEPERYVGARIGLASDEKSLDECRATWTAVHGKPPRKFPMPLWLFERVTGPGGKDLPTMWRWLRDGSLPDDTAGTREIHPAAMSVREFLERSRSVSNAPAPGMDA